MKKIIINIIAYILGVIFMMRFIYQLINNNITNEFIIGESIVLLIVLFGIFYFKEYFIKNF